MKHLLLQIALLCAVASVLGQPTLSLGDAISRALEYNFGLQTARMNAEVAENTAIPGQAGLLPVVAISGGANYNLNNAAATLINPNPGPGAPSTIEQKISGIQTYGANAALGVSYTVFDGMGAVSNYRLLKTNAALSETQLRILLQSTLTQVIGAYYQMARQQRALAIRSESLDRSRNRLEFVQTQERFAAANRLAVLNAEVDLNSDSVAYAAVALAIENARQDLNYLLGQPVETVFLVEEAIVLAPMPSLDEVIAGALADNPEVEAARLNQEVAELNLKIAKAGRMPRLDVNASYGINYANNGPISFLQQITSNGFAGTASLNVPLFAGFRNQTAVANAELGTLTARTQRIDREAALQRDAAKAYAAYQHSLYQIRLNQRSLDAARLNFERTQEVFELGQATSLQYREAQLNLLTVENRLNDLRFEVKIQETELLRLAGRLLTGS